MILLQNPTLPNPTDPVEIDRAIQDLQVKLATNLPWLTQAYPRAYPQIESTQKAQPSFIFPAIYLGKSNNDYKYLNAAPDNDKKAQCFFLVDTETVNDFVRGEHNIMSYSLSIVFTANLKLVNDTTLATEIFQANLIKEVREVLTRDITLTPYDLKINGTKLLFRDVYKEFQLQNAAVLEKAPFTHFRIECELILQEECGTTIVDRCVALRNNVNSEDDLICLISLYDFSQTAIQNALSPTQVADLQAAFCTAMPSTCEEKLAFIAPDRDSCFIPSLDFSAGFDDDFNALNVTQKSDLSTRICTTVNPQMYRMLLDGMNEYFQTPSSTALDFTNTEAFSAAIWVQSSNYAVTQTMFSRRVPATTRGYVFFFLGGNLYLYVATSIGNYMYLRTNGVTFTNNVEYLVGFTKSTSSSYAGFKVYVNGVQVSTIPIQDNLNGTMASSEPMLIGADSISGWYFTGFLGLYRLWGEERTAGQMLAEYNGGFPLNVPTSLGSQRFGWKGGQDAYFGQQWVFRDESGNMINPLPYSINVEFAKRQAI